jgi:hypothetical protein
VSDQSTGGRVVRGARDTAGALTTAVAAIASAATLVGWIASDELLRSARIALICVGFLLFLAFMAMLLRELIRVVARRDWEPWLDWPGAVVGLTVVGILGYNAARGDLELALFAGAVTVAIGLARGVAEVVHSRHVRARTAAEREFAERAELRACPACAEQIRAAARICRHCGSDLGDDEEVRWA